MTVEISNALFGYFEALYDLNRNLIMLCGVDVIDNEGQYENVCEKSCRIFRALSRMLLATKSRSMSWMITRGCWSFATN